MKKVFRPKKIKKKNKENVKVCRHFGARLRKVAPVVGWKWIESE